MAGKGYHGSRREGGWGARLRSFGATAGKPAGLRSGASVYLPPLMRTDGRADDELRPITFQRHFNDHPQGSVLVSFGNTKVLCTALVEEGVPPWMERSGLGWVTAEYGMLPGSTAQ